MAASRSAGSGLLRQAEAQQAFDRDGFVVLDLLEPAQISHLTRFLQQLPEPDGARRGFRASMDHPDAAVAAAANAEIARVVGQALAPHVWDPQVFVASFVVKDASASGLVPPHQDWTFVDESRFASATVWVPLVDVGPANGGLGIIPGSHQVLDHVRASPSPQFPSALSRHMVALYPYLQVQTLRAGQALVYDHRMVHGSPPNRSDLLRIAAAVGVARREAALVHHYYAPGAQSPAIETYAVEPDFFLHHGNKALAALFEQRLRPAARLVRSEPYTQPTFTTGELLARLQEHPAVRIDPELARSAPQDFAALARPA